MAILFLVAVLAVPVRADPPPTGPFLDEAFRVAQGAMASKAGNALMQIGVRAAAGEGGLSVLMRERQALTNALDGIEDRLTLPGADTVAPTGEADALQSRLAGVDARVSADYPEFRALTRPRPLTVAEVQALLSPDEALVLTFVGDNATCVFAVSKTSAGWHRLLLAREELVNNTARGAEPGAEGLSGLARAFLTDRPHRY